MCDAGKCLVRLAGWQGRVDPLVKRRGFRIERARHHHEVETAMQCVVENLTMECDGFRTELRHVAEYRDPGM